MNYILKSKTEAQRLTEQSLMESYSLQSELEDLHLSRGTKILDAGCGSGVLCHYLEKKFDGILINGCDIDEESLAFAKSKSMSKNSTYFKHDILNSSLPGKYDIIFNRFVGHHLGKQRMQQVLKNFYEALNPGGKVCIIDIDGLMINLATEEDRLLEKIILVKNKFSGNLHQARIIPSLLSKAGFQNINWKISTIDFKGDEKKQEIDQWQSRFESAINFYIDVFGTESEARYFFKDYLTEARKEEIPLFYNKFIVHGTKAA